MVTKLNGQLSSTALNTDIYKELFTNDQPQTVSDYARPYLAAAAESKKFGHDTVFSMASSWCLNDRIERSSEYPVACGGYADVWKGSLGSVPVAIKVMRPFASNNGRRIEPKKLLRRLWHEFHGWSCLQHENIIPCLGFSYDFSPDTSTPSLISPWMENGTIKTYIEVNPDTDRLDLILGIAKGLSYLHNRHPTMVHGDLRAGNVLVSESGIPRLSDFGLSRIMSEVGGTTTTAEIAGSLRWMSPELLRGKPVSTTSDIWAFGMTILELLSGNRPWQELSFDHMVLCQLLDGKLPSRPKGEYVRDVLDDEVWAICKKCWAQEGSERPSMDIVTSEILAIIKPAKLTGVWQPKHHVTTSISTSLSVNSRDSHHTFHPPSGSDSRGLCPGLNTLANHGYLPRDGHNIWPEDLLAAIKDKETYHLSDTLARVIVYGGLPSLLKFPPLSLHDLTRRKQVELDDEFVTVDQIARKQFANFNPDPIHQEMALAEWALVLEIFGRTHGGKVPSGLLRVWLTKNQFPEGWKPTHEQGFSEVALKSTTIRRRMNEIRQEFS